MPTQILLNAIKESSNTQLRELKELNETQIRELNGLKETQIRELDGLKEIIMLRFKKIDEQLAEVYRRLDKQDKDIEFLKRHVNEIQQEKLSTHLEITGIEKPEIDRHQKDLTEYAREIIGSFGIQIESSAVQHAFTRTVAKTNKSIVTVVLSSVEAKALVMKRKRESNDKRKIFFDHRLTNLNRAMFTVARKIVKNSNGTALIKRGRVFISQDEKLTSINSFADLDKYTQPETYKNYNNRKST